MTKSTSPLPLRRATLIAAIGTTVYTLFEPVCRMIVGDRWWLYFDDHMLYNDVWHIFFSSVLIVCVVFAIGLICEGKHFPILGKGIRYMLLGIAIVSCGNILWFALSANRRIMDTVPWLYLLFLLGADAVLWYIYIHATEDIQPSRSRWQKSICRISVLLALSVLAKQIPSVIWYVWRCTQFPVAHVSMFRNILGRCDWLCNGLILCVSIVFFLLVILQPLITRRAQN